MPYQNSTITVQNLSATTQFIGGVSLSAGATQDIPLSLVQTQVNLWDLLLSGALTFVETPNYQWAGIDDAQYPWQSVWLPAQQLSVTPYTVPVTPYLGLAHTVRLFANAHTSSGVSVSLSTSPNGGVTWYPLTEWAQSGTLVLPTTPVQALLPAALPLVQATVTFPSSITPTVSLTLIGQ